MENSNDLIIWRRDEPGDKIWWGNIYHGISEDDFRAGNITASDLDSAVWWDDDEIIFSFDKKKIFRLFRDYPEALTPEEKAIFDKENPFWTDFFKSRTKSTANY